MQKIAHINLAKGFRGGERQTLILMEELSKRGYWQILVAREGSSLAKRSKFIKNLEIIEISKPYIFNLPCIKDASLLHAHETKGAHFAYFANIFYNRPYIVTRRVDNIISNNIFNKRLYKNSSFTVALSTAIEGEILKISSVTKVEIIPSAYSKMEVDIKSLKDIKKRFNSSFLVGHVGELDNSHKGQYYLMEAMRQIETKYPDIHLILLGKGRDEKRFKNQAKGIENITFEGFVDNVSDYIASFDLFVFPSLQEGLGSILLDVMNLEVPIIATKVGGIVDIIEDGKNGILVDSRDSEAIYKNIVELYKNPNLAKELVKNAKDSIENYSPTRMADRYIELYKRVV